jgi:hypothetical protein
LAAATAGQTVCVAAGNYGNVAAVNKTSPGVTVRPASGVARSSVQMSFNWNDSRTPAAWLTFDGVTVNNLNVSAPTHDVTWRNSEMAGPSQLNAGASPNANNACGNCPAMNNQNILFEGNDFSLSRCPDLSCAIYQGRLEVMYTASTPAGITIRGNLFHGGCADGIQFGGDAGYGVLIQGNTFRDMLQSVCEQTYFPGRESQAPHIDAVQGVGVTGFVFDSNLVLNNSTGVVNYDGDASNVVVTNNVIETEGDAVVVCAAKNLRVEHNTIKRGNVWNCVNHGQTPSTNTVWRNNIQPGAVGVQGGSTFSVYDYNMCTKGTCAGSHSMSGTPSWLGGTNPQTFSGYALTGSSAGKRLASDGSDIGANPS